MGKKFNSCGSFSESGHILSCGIGSSGQLGQGGVTLEQDTMKPILNSEDKRFVYVSAGDNHSAAISGESFP